ncbi:MAG: histidinol-phosphate transaminase [Eubacteriales bacterium]
MSRFYAENHRNLIPYVPGEQPRDQQYIKLNTNESPFPPSPKVIAALNAEAVSKLNLYSDPTVSPLNQAIANYYGLSVDRIFVGNGSDEVLAFAFQAFCDRNHPLIFPDVTYGCYSVFSDLYGIPYSRIPLDDSFTIRVEDYVDRRENVVIANPNAQTGTYLPPDQIERLVASNPDRLVIVDEAYIDFGGQTAVPMTEKYDNLLVVQTFSKSRNLAGARVGFAVGAPELIADLLTIKYSFNPYNINRLSMAAAVEAISDVEYFESCTDTIRKNREWTKDQLTELGFECTDSYANFLLARSDRMDGESLYLRLKSRGILVRHFSDQRIAECVRITIGSMEQMQALIFTIGELLADGDSGEEQP